MKQYLYVLTKIALTNSSFTKNASRHCKICATNLLSYLMNTISLEALFSSTPSSQSTIITTTVWLSLAQFAVSRC